MNEEINKIETMDEKSESLMWEPPKLTTLGLDELMVKLGPSRSCSGFGG